MERLLNLAPLAWVAGLEIAYRLARRFLTSFRPRGLFRSFQLVSTLLVAGMAWRRLPTTTAAWKVLISLAILLGAFLVFSFLEAAVARATRSDTPSKNLPKLARDVLRAVLLMTLVFVLAHLVFGVEIDRLTISSATVVAILGFALQDVLKNVFAGMTLQIEHAFQRGDWLLLREEGGKQSPARVVDMTFRATHLRTNDGHLWIVPNSEIAAQRLTNLGSGAEPVGMAIFLSLPYSLPPVDAKKMLLEAVRSTPGISEAPRSEVFVHEFGDSGVTYRVRAWSREQNSLVLFRDSIHNRIWYRLQRDGIALPYRTQTVRVHNQDRADQRDITRRSIRTESLLAELPLFAELPALSLRALAAFGRERHYDSGEVLVREGESGGSLYIVERGQVRVTKSAGGESSLELATLGAGEFFGEHSLLTGEPRTATVLALTSCEVFVLDREAMAPVLALDPGLAESLSRALVARDAETEAKLESHRSRDRRALAETEHSLLARIRSFFALPHDQD